MSNDAKIDVELVVPLIVQGLQGPATKELVALTIDFAGSAASQYRSSYVGTKSSDDAVQTLVQSEQTQTWLVSQIEQAQSIVPKWDAWRLCSIQYSGATEASTSTRNPR